MKGSEVGRNLPGARGKLVMAPRGGETQELHSQQAASLREGLPQMSGPQGPP